MNFNTFLLALVVAGIGFIGWTSWGNATSLAELKGAMIGRPEFESKLADIKAQQQRTDAAIVAIQLSLGEIRNGYRSHP